MTVQCCECGKVVGEKCGKCGAPATLNRKSVAGKPLAFCSDSVNCGAQWRVGTDAVSHGFCSECFNRQMAELETLYGPESKQIVRTMGKVAE